MNNVIVFPKSLNLKVLEHSHIISLSALTICYSAEISKLRQLGLFDHIEKPDYLENAAQTRCDEFFAGRILAQAILEQYFNEIRAITSVQHKLPIWSAGITGCISHSKNTVVVVISNQAEYLGIDIENRVNKSFAEDSTAFILSEFEQQLWQTGQIQGLSFCEYLTLIFSIKESLYKAVYPIAQQYIDFLEASVVQINLEHQSVQLSFCLEVQQKYSLLECYQGYWKIQGDVILTWVFKSHV